MKIRIMMLVVGIALGAFMGGFLSSETITYYNCTQAVASFESFKETFNDTQVASASMIVPAVDENGHGVASILNVQIIPGERRALVDIDKILFFTDTQNSIRISRSVSENVTGIDLSYYDIMYSIEADASVIEGPSAGAAMTVATIAALTGQEPDPDTMMTGTINFDGTIGPVGEILAKATAAKEIGATLFLVPKGQSTETVYESVEHCTDAGGSRVCNIQRIPRTVDISEEAGIGVVEVDTIQDAMDYFFRGAEGTKAFN
jgi:uncharacterized protein